MARILTEKDLTPALKLATNSTKDLVISGVNGHDDFPILLSKYTWAGTRDYNMALIIIAFFAYCAKSENIDLQKFGFSVRRSSGFASNLLRNLKLGDGRSISIMLNDNFGRGKFKDHLETVLKEALPDDKDKEKREKIINSFIKQAKKITSWKTNKQEISEVVDQLCGMANRIERSKYPKKITVKDRDYFRVFMDSNSKRSMISNLSSNEVKIFPKGRPLPSEVMQAGAGDCVLMSQLIALAKTNPEAITDCFVQGLDKIEKEDKIDIRFFRCDVPREMGLVSVIITVKKNRVIGGWRIEKGGALWPKLIEKAYAVYAKEGFADPNGKSLSIEDGEANQHVTFAITGNISKSVGPDFVKGKPENVIDTIKRKLNKSRVLTCGFKAKFKIRDVKNNEEIEIHDKHSYAIVGINEDKKYIRLIEPNKVLGRKYSTKLINTDWPEPAQEGGHIAMSFNDFKNNFSTLSYSTSKKSKSYKVSDFD